MAEIKTYESAEAHQGLRPSNAGASAMARIGASMEETARYQQQTTNAIGQQIGGAIKEAAPVVAGWYNKLQVQNEMSKGGALSAQVFDDLTNSWNDTAKQAPANDTSVVPKWREEVLEKKLKEFQEGFQTEKGKQWAQSEVDSFRKHFFEKTTADASARAVTALKQNLGTAGNGFTNAVRVDPTAMDMTMQRAGKYIDGLVDNSPGVDARNAAAAKESLRQDMFSAIAVAAARGRIDGNVEEGRKWVQAGNINKWADADTVSKLLAYADQVETKKKAEAKAAEVAQRQKQEDDLNKATVKNLTDNVVVSPDGSLTIKPGFFERTHQIAESMPGVKPSLVTAQFNFGRAIQDDAEKGVKVVSDPAVYDSFRKRAFLDANDPNRLGMEEVYKARIDHKLSDKDFTLFKSRLNDDYNNPQTKDQYKQLDTFFDKTKSAITKTSMMSTDPYGDIRMLEWQQAKTAEFEAGLKAGLTPRAMLDPASKDFIGRDITRYMANDKAVMQKQIDDFKNGKSLPPPVNGVVSNQRLPNESPQDYIKRINGVK